MRTWRIAIELRIKQLIDLVERRAFNTEETINESAIELPHLVEHAPHVIGTILG